MNQLILTYQKNVKQTFDNFYYNSSENKQVLNSIKNIFNDNNSQIFLWGENCLGKSHILYSACNHFGKFKKKCIYLPMKNYKKFSSDILQGIDKYDLVCIDDIDYIFGLDEWEKDFFFLVNKIISSPSKIIYTSSSNIAASKLNLKDLHSRISWGLILKIYNEDDSTKEKILKKIISDKEYNVSTSVCSYLLKRKERDLSSLIKTIHKLGLYSFSTNKKVNLKDVSSILSL